MNYRPMFSCFSRCLNENRGLGAVPAFAESAAAISLPPGPFHPFRCSGAQANRCVTPGCFETPGIPLARGRDISVADTHDRQFVAVVSRSVVRRYWPTQDPIGRHFTFAFADREVVGVTGDVRFRGLERDGEPQVYLSSQQVEDGAAGPACGPRHTR